MNETVNLHLPQFEATDRIHHDDFNEAMAKIDTAMTACGNCHIAIGSYVGTGQYGVNHPNTLTFDFEPKFVCITYATKQFGQAYLKEVVRLLRPLTCSTYLAGQSSSSTINGAKVEWDGNTVRWYSEGGSTSADGQQNSEDITYSYYAIG